MVVYAVAEVEDSQNGQLYVSNVTEARKLARELLEENGWATVTRLVIPSRITKEIALNMLNGRGFVIESEEIVSWERKPNADA